MCSCSWQGIFSHAHHMNEHHARERRRTCALHTNLTLPFFFLVFFLLPVPAISFSTQSFSQVHYCAGRATSRSVHHLSKLGVPRPYCCGVTNVVPRFFFLCLCWSVCVSAPIRPSQTMDDLAQRQVCPCSLFLTSPVVAVPMSVVDPHVSTHACTTLSTQNISQRLITCFS